MNNLKVSELTKYYGDKKALDNFSFQVEAGEIVGLIGKNGAGKTTLLNCIAGNIYPDFGSIHFDNNDLLVENEIRKDFGILIQPSFLDYLNTYDNLRLLQNAVGVWEQEVIQKQSDDLLKIVGLEGKGKKYVKSFSFGMKQRLGFAQALLNGHKFLILDEPFVGLDINGRAMVKEYIKKMVKDKQIGVIFSDHNLDEVRSLCKRVIVISDGKKIYDKNLEEEKKYIIGVENINQEMIKTVTKIQGVEVDVKKMCLNFQSSIDIHNVIEAIMPHTRINYIKLLDNNLENMLNGGMK